MNMAVFGVKQHSRLVLTHGQGGYCWDTSGNRYLDLSCGFGPIVLGHADPAVCQSVERRLARGNLFAWSSPEHSELADLLCELFPFAGGCAFLKTGSEAIAAAARIARSVTGRSLVIRCGFHGWHDAMIAPNYPWHGWDPPRPPGTPVRGVAEHAGDDWCVWTGESFDTLEALYNDRPTSVAALLIDPVQLREPILVNLARLKDLVRRQGSLLILDEVKTGFRVHLSGVSGLYGVSPDLIVLSKAMANGFPISAVLGTRDVMADAGSVKLKGTYNGELTSVVAALTTIRRLQTDDIPAQLDELGTHFLSAFNQMTDALGLAAEVQAVPYRWPCMPYIRFTPATSGMAEELGRSFVSSMLEEGVLLIDDHMNYLCAAHNRDDLDRGVRSASQVLSQMHRHGRWQ